MVGVIALSLVQWLKIQGEMGKSSILRLISPKINPLFERISTQLYPMQEK